jgi:hypothetical protein
MVVDLSPSPKASQAVEPDSGATPSPSYEVGSEATPLPTYEAGSEANPSPSNGESSEVNPTVEPCSDTTGVNCDNVRNAPPANEGNAPVQPPLGTGGGAGEGENGAVDSTSHAVSIRFNETVQQSDIEDVAGVLAKYDPDADLQILQLFPPVGHAVIKSDVPGFCKELKAQLSDRPYIDSVSCE